MTALTQRSFSGCSTQALQSGGHTNGMADASGWWIKEPESATTIDYSTNRLGDVQFNGITVHLTQEAYSQQKVMPNRFIAPKVSMTTANVTL